MQRTGVVRFELVMVHSPHDRTVLGGRDMSAADISMEDFEKIIEVEQWLERLLGKRVHINQTTTLQSHSERAQSVSEKL